MSELKLLPNTHFARHQILSGSCKWLWRAKHAQYVYSSFFPPILDLPHDVASKVCEVNISGGCWQSRTHAVTLYHRFEKPQSLWTCFCQKAAGMEKICILHITLIPVQGEVGGVWLILKKYTPTADYFYITTYIFVFIARTREIYHKLFHHILRNRKSR